MSAPNPPADTDATARRTRFRRIRFDSDKKKKIANRVIDFADKDWEAMSGMRDRQLQLYAKYRMWSEGSNGFPWPDSSDYATPDMASDSQRTQDTLHNAVMSNRPIVTSSAVNKINEEKQDQIDHLIDHQVFVEQSGESIIGEATEVFVNEPSCTLFVNWVREDNKAADLKIFPRIPRNAPPIEFFRKLLDQEFPESRYLPNDENVWDWRVYENDLDDPFRVSFYTRQDDLKTEMLVERQIRVFDGPAISVKDLTEILFPSRAANLQIPGPSNPKGATHVIVPDRPTVDEIKRLQREGFYDAVSAKMLEGIEDRAKFQEHEESDDQKDSLSGHRDETLERSGSHRTLTRYVCFDRWDIDGDGLDEDVVFWVLREGGLLLRWRRLGEVYPLSPPRRPFAEGQYLPVKGRRSGISLLELMESTHDTLKALFDQMVDSGTLANSPFGFYRPQSNVKPEVMSIFPGDLWPLTNPQQDINFPNLSSAQSQAFGQNMIVTLQGMGERLSMIGDLAFGQIPKGKSSALRTSGNLQSLLSLGEARPERIIRRFFMMLTDAWSIIHGLNSHFLPDEKKFRIMGVQRPGMDPYMAVERENLSGDYHFDFQANVQNASKVAMQEALSSALQISMSPVAFQAGVTTPDEVYNLLFGLYKAFGLDPEKFVAKPTPTAGVPRIFAEDALTALIQEQFPVGEPEEMGGAREHLQKMVAFAESESFGVMSKKALQLFSEYIKQVDAKIKAQEEQERLALAAGSGPQLGPGETPGPEAQQAADMAPAKVEGNELRDESLPTAGGGANTQ